MGIRDICIAARLKAGRSISSVAKDAGLMDSHLSRFERGEKRLRVERLEQLLDALDLVVVPRDHVCPPSDAAPSASAA